MESLIREGGCRCGQVRFRLTAEPVVTMACHCTGCQSMTASAFSLAALYPSKAFEVTQGEPVIGGLHGDAHHFFCPYCMSWMFTRVDVMGDLVSVRAMLCDDARGFVPFIETYISEKLPWATTPAVHSFPRYPPMEQFPALLAEYAARSPAGT